MASTLSTANASRAGGSAPLHLAHVEGLRALAAYVVYINHAYAQTWNPSHLFPPSFLSLFTYSLVAGHLSVTVFIVISGFCLMLPVVRAGNQLRGGASAFFKRRARRILPPYYGALAFCLLAIFTIIGKPTGTLWDVPIHVNAVAVISHLVLVQDLFGTSKINYVFWSIAVEWQIYFLFPALVWSWQKYGPAITVGTALVLGYAIRFGFGDTRVVRAAPQYLGLFTLGMLAAAVVQGERPSLLRARASALWGWLAVLSLGAVCALCYVWGWELAVARYHLLDAFVGVAAMSTLVIASRAPGVATARVFSWKPLAFIGTFSYSVYLIHAPLLQILWQYVLAPAHLAPVTMFAVFMGPGAIVILALAYAFFRVCEEPFMSRSAARAESPAACTPLTNREGFASAARQDSGSA